MTDNCTKIFNALIGEWTLERKITSFLDGFPSAEFAGIGLFKKVSDNVLEYTEKGVLTRKGARVGEATQSYLWQLEGDDIVVYFNNETTGTKRKRFHTLNFADGVDTQTEHWCDPDNYETEYSFEKMPHKFKITHKVEGPRKNYTSVTNFTRSP